MTLTTMRTRIGTCLLLGLVGLSVPSLLAPQDAWAQRTTADVQVRITAGGGAPPAGVTVVILNTDTGFAALATARADGSHVVTGLAPGEYLVTATQPGGKEVYRLVTLQVGQSATVGLDLGAEPVEGRGETIVVEGRVTEATNSEIATNVTREQIENLPQNNRNFLNFAQLAPGVRLNQDEFRQELQSGAQPAAQTNIFIDGVSLKSHVLQGGTVGQDASRGNPFPQLAVGGFRVITQNYKAEYEQAGSAIISAVTRTGSNEYHGDVFTQFQHDSITTTDFFVKDRGDPEPDLVRYQVGAAASGPVVKDKAFIFLTYEGNYQNRQNQVLIANAPPELGQFPGIEQRINDAEGTFTSPFREHLGFGKFTWRPRDNQNVDITASLRTETDVRSFGGQASFEQAENVRNQVITASAKHQLWLGSALNEATFQFLENHFRPEADNFGLPGEQFFAAGPGNGLVMHLGGRASNQDIGQRSFNLRDDVTFSDIEGGGQHVIKTGAKISVNRYNVDKQLDENPTFKYGFLDVTGNPDGTPDGVIDDLGDLTWAAPAEATYGVGDPLVDANNLVFGLYVQDDWTIADRLTLNLGVRWDVETNMLNNDYVTPDNVRAGLTETGFTYAPDPAAPLCDGTTSFEQCLNMVNGNDWFTAANYLTDGRSDRPVFLGAIQPRLGLAFDVLGDGNTILFGGAGRYYDRALFNDGLDEKYRLQHEVRTFFFSRDGLPRNGADTIMWDPSGAYLSADGLNGLIEQGVAPEPEIFLIENDTRPVHTDHFSGGVRQAAGPLSASATFTHVRSENGLGFYPVNRLAEPSAVSNNREFINGPGDGFANVLVSSDDRQSRYTAVQVSFEKPLDAEWSGGGISWGASIAYTLGWAKERGSLFMFDYPTIEDSPLVPTATDERHRLVLSGIAVLPLDFTLSTLITLGSGLPYTITDVSAGDNDRNKVIDVNGGRDDKALEFRQVDARITKSFKLVDEHRVNAFVECFNIFNSKNFGGYGGFIGVDGPADDFGKPSRLIALPRAFQLGMSYHF